MKMRLVAQFIKPDDAARFAARLREPEWWAEEVRYKPGTVKVEWGSDPFQHSEATNAEHDYFTYLSETVGFYGSTHNRRAQLMAELTDEDGNSKQWGPVACPYTL